MVETFLYPNAMKETGSQKEKEYVPSDYIPTTKKEKKTKKGKEKPDQKEKQDKNDVVGNILQEMTKAKLKPISSLLSSRDSN